ncbi:MAG: hypothetical protein IEMM0003_0083 [bacterium]|nr:MAG: hypothetical protein IEMM0003_0083 [bacterium]
MAIFDIIILKTQIAGFHSDNLYDKILLFWIFRYFKIVIPFAEQTKTIGHFYITLVSDIGVQISRSFRQLRLQEGEE